MKPSCGLSGEFPLEYESWKGLKSRCLNPKHVSWKEYGGRGIKVCNRWKNSFLLFLRDMGPRPSSNHQVDRINGNGDYTPENCRWSTVKEQARNRRNCRLLTHQGETLCIAEWSERTRIGWEIIDGRLKRGWSIEETLTTPSTLRKPHLKPRKNLKTFSLNGKTNSLINWCREYKIPDWTVRQRMKMGWSFEKALTTPVGKYRKQS